MMRGRIWLVVGAVIGIAMAAGHLPYLAGAGRSLADTAERLVGSGADRLIRAAARTGAPRRVVLGLAGVVAAILPGVTALLLIVAARSSLRLRAIIGLLIVALGAASYVYQPHGQATGRARAGPGVARLAVVVTGPLVAAPLAALAGLIGGEFLPAGDLGHGRSPSAASTISTRRSTITRARRAAADPGVRRRGGPVPPGRPPHRHPLSGPVVRRGESSPGSSQRVTRSADRREHVRGRTPDGGGRPDAAEAGRRPASCLPRPGIRVDRRDLGPDGRPPGRPRPT